MPRYIVTSGEIKPTNGNAPYSKHVWAKKPEDAAWKAIPLGRGTKITSVTPFEYDHAELTYKFFVRTDKETTFQVVVQETFSFGLFRIFGKRN